MNKMDSIREAKRIIEKANYPNVHTVGIGYKTKNGKRTKDLSVIVFVTKKLTESQLKRENLIPRTLTVGSKTVKTDVIKSGKFKALGTSSIQEFNCKVRPIKPGFSVGHPNITAGTIGCFVRNIDYRMCILSNNHVLANVNRGLIGDPIFQPGVHDGGSIDDRVAKLTEFVSIDMALSSCPVAKFFAWVLNGAAKLSGSNSRLWEASNIATNLVDCAIAEIDDGIEIDHYVPAIGIPDGLVEAELGMKVRKSGRTTEYTTGEVIAVEVTTTVNMGVGNAVFEDQVVLTNMSAGGDSGSAIFDDGTNLVGLLFAGSDEMTVANRIQNVFSELRVKLP